jgi:DNA-binding FadR family transcriptional regulator
MSTSLHHRAVEHLGTRIVDGSLPPGHVMLAEQLEDELQVSRSVIREAVRVLQSLGLVETTKRVGIKVLPAHRWNPFDPLVIRWRLAGEGRGAQLRSLAELRSAVEPVAAELAAANAPQELRQELLDVALAMRDAGQAGDVPRFLELDIQFHSLLLSGSGNEMFANLVGQVAETLTGRTVHGLMPDRPGTSRCSGTSMWPKPSLGATRRRPGRRRAGSCAAPSRKWSPYGWSSRGFSFRCSGGRSPPSPSGLALAAAGLDLALTLI